MMEVKMISLLGGEISVYGLGMILGCIGAAAWFILRAGKHGIRKGRAAVYGLFCVLLGLLLGRTVYCAVRFDRMFFDEMGDFAGLSPFFDYHVIFWTACTLSTSGVSAFHDHIVFQRQT